jgi:hypothetical protein
MIEYIFPGGACVALGLVGIACYLSRKSQNAPVPSSQTVSYVTEEAETARPKPPVAAVDPARPGLTELESRLGTKLLAPEIIPFQLFEERTGKQLYARSDEDEAPTEPTPALQLDSQPEPKPRCQETALMSEIRAFLRDQQ